MKKCEISQRPKETAPALDSAEAVWGLAWNSRTVPAISPVLECTDRKIRDVTPVTPPTNDTA
jgi:hypothetical protein